MDGVLFDTITDVSCTTNLMVVVRELRQEVAELRQELAHVRRENLELRQQAGYWKSQHARANLKIQELEREVERLRGENRKLQDQHFGRKCEKQSAADRSNHLEGEEEPAPKRPRGQQRGRPGPQRRNYDHLPAVDEPH